MAKRKPKKVKPLEEMVKDLERIIVDGEKEAIDQDAGNQSAGGRLRKLMQEMKVKAQDIRFESLNRRK